MAPSPSQAPLTASSDGEQKYHGPALSPARAIFAGSLRAYTNIQYESCSLSDAFPHQTDQVRQVPFEQIG